MMDAKPWFRLYREFATDPKIQTLPETMQRRYVMILCLQCSGDLQKLDIDEIAYALRLTVDEVEETRKCLARKGLIDDGWNIPAWDRRQYQSDDSKDRVRRFRERKRAETQDVTKSVTGNVTPVTVTVTPSDAETDADTDTDTETETEKKEADASCAEPPSDSTPAPKPALMFPVNDSKKEWGLSANKVGEWEETYPYMDVLAECRKARQWILDNPTNRKTAAGMHRFLGAWLSRSNNRGNYARAAIPRDGPRGKPGEPLPEIIRHDEADLERMLG